MTGNEFIDNLIQNAPYNCVNYKGTVIKLEFCCNYCNVIGENRNMYVKYDYSYEDTELCFDIAAGLNENIGYHVGSDHTVDVNVNHGYSEIIIERRTTRNTINYVGAWRKKYLYEHNHLPLSEFLTKTRSTLEMLDLESPDVFDDYARIMNSHKIKRCNQ